mmetsp:Transcript_32562/g.64558  ORF Transcript_32562/g.64558 Transcript_32562/m.64558 type:complete len:561 (-) Transcript_32562:124-1806(-)
MAVILHRRGRPERRILHQRLLILLIDVLLVKGHVLLQPHRVAAPQHPVGAPAARLLLGGRQRPSPLGLPAQRRRRFFHGHLGGMGARHLRLRETRPPPAPAAVPPQILDGRGAPPYPRLLRLPPRPPVVARPRGVPALARVASRVRPAPVGGGGVVVGGGGAAPLRGLLLGPDGRVVPGGEVLLEIFGEDEGAALVAEGAVAAEGLGVFGVADAPVSPGGAAARLPRRGTGRDGFHHNRDLALAVRVRLVRLRVDVVSGPPRPFRFGRFPLFLPRLPGEGEGPHEVPRPGHGPPAAPAAAAQEGEEGPGGAVAAPAPSRLVGGGGPAGAGAAEARHAEIGREIRLGAVLGGRRAAPCERDGLELGRRRRGGQQGVRGRRHFLVAPPSRFPRFFLQSFFFPLFFTFPHPQFLAGAQRARPHGGIGIGEPFLVLVVGGVAAFRLSVGLTGAARRVVLADVAPGPGLGGLLAGEAGGAPLLGLVPLRPRLADGHLFHDVGRHPFRHLPPRAGGAGAALGAGAAPAGPRGGRPAGAPGAPGATGAARATGAAGAHGGAAPGMAV